MKITKEKNVSYFSDILHIKLPSGKITIVPAGIGDWDKVVFPSGLTIEICPDFSGFSMKIIPHSNLRDMHNYCCPGSALSDYDTKRMTPQDEKTLAEYMIARWGKV